MKKLVTQKNEQETKSNAVALREIIEAQNAAKNTLEYRKLHDEVYGKPDLNPITHWVNQIYNAFYRYEDKISGAEQVALSLEEIMKYMTPLESEAIGKLVKATRDWLWCYFIFPYYKDKGVLAEDEN